MAQLSTYATKATPIDADSFPITDSAASNATKRVLFSALQTWVYSLFGYTAASASGGTQMRFLEDTDNGTNYVNLKAPALLAANPEVSLPAATGVLALVTDVETAVASAYAAGGTDVAVADGGTGASDAAGARTNLGAAATASPTFTGSINITAVAYASLPGSPANGMLAMINDGDGGQALGDITTGGSSRVQLVFYSHDSAAWVIAAK